MPSRPVIGNRLALVALVPALVGAGYILGRGERTPSTAPPALARVASASAALAHSPASTAVSSADETARPAPPLCAATEERMRQRLQARAASDPTAALRLAESASSPRQRVLFRNAVLREWASHDSRAAAGWALVNVRMEERRAAVEEIALGAVARPDEAMQTFLYLITADPQLAGDHGNALVHALARAGQYEDASEFAAAAPAEHRSAWLCTVFNQWAAYEPRTAFAALEKISDSASRREARDSLLAGWAASDPAALVTFSETLPAGETKTEALRSGLDQWVRISPGDASAWMETFEPGPEFDAGAAAVATIPALVARKPDVAISWAESIVNPELRANTLLDLIRLWGARDANAARRYAIHSPALRPELRQLALAALQPSP